MFWWKMDSYQADDLLLRLIAVLDNTIFSALEFAKHYPKEAFVEQRTGDKVALQIDNYAQHIFQDLCQSNCNLEVVGEESFAQALVTENPFIVADIIDGTDLFERGIDLWCSAICLVDPTAAVGRRLVGTCVATFVKQDDGVLSRTFYLASADKDDVWVYNWESRDERRGRNESLKSDSVPNPLRVRRARGPSKVTLLQKAGVCFYGQKVNRLRHPAMRKLFSNCPDGVRFYNFAGNPMLAKLVDSSPNGKSIDAVFEIAEGQKPWDFVAGAFIALKGGAFLLTSEEAPISSNDLEDALFSLKGKTRYVAACTEALAREIVLKSRSSTFKDLIDSHSLELNHLRTPNFSFKLKPTEEGCPVALVFSPHPDDESLVGSFALRLRKEGVRIVNVVMTLGSKASRKLERSSELNSALKILGFEREDLKSYEPGNSKEAAEILKKYSPKFVFCPHSQDSHPTHIAVSNCVREALGSFKRAIFLVETEYWHPMVDPNFLVETSSSELEALVTAVSSHVGEVSRSKYHLRLPSWLSDNVRRSEMFIGKGAAAPDMQFGTLYRVSKWVKGVPMGRKKKFSCLFNSHSALDALDNI